MSENGVFFSILFVDFPTWDWNQYILLTRKTKKNDVDFGHKLGKLVSNLKVNITKIGKMTSETFMIIFTF